MALALEGIKVIDVAQVAAVPLCARFLADFGADVIHVENPATGDMYRELGNRFAKDTGHDPEINFIWENANRNKRGITLDLAQEAGQQVMYRLVATADVFLTNMRPFELEKFRLEYPTLSQINPRLVYGSLTGYGKQGPDRNEPGYDFSAYWARSGIASKVPSYGCPPDVPPAAFGDSVAGLAMALGVLIALRARENTGVGQEVDISLFHTGVYNLSQEISGTIISGQPHEDRLLRAKRQPPNPLLKVYRTKDDRWLLLVALTPDRYWTRFCRTVGLEHLENDPRFNSIQMRARNSAVLTGILEDMFLSKTLEEWKVILKGFPFDAIQNSLEVVNDPQATANNVFPVYNHPTHGPITVVGNPIGLTGTPATLRLPAPEFGQHNEEILLEYGYTWEEIDRLKQQRVIT